MNSQWHSIILKIAGIYNILWGSSVVLFPDLFFEMVGMKPPGYPWLWQVLGMVIGVYGVGYYLAGFDPKTHWPIVFVGMLGKIFGPIGFAIYLFQGAFPVYFGLLIIFNDLIWWYPFLDILRKSNMMKHLKSYRNTVRVDTNT